MGIFRYKFKMTESISGGLYGHGFSSNAAGAVYMNSAAPYLDFYNGATFLFRISGLHYATGTKNGAPHLGFCIDTSAGGVETYTDDETWPVNLDRLRVYLASNEAVYGADLTSTTFADTNLSTTDGAKFDNNFLKTVEYRGATATLTNEAGLIAQVDQEFVAEWSGNFTHVDVVNTWPAWDPAPAQGTYTRAPVFIAQDQANGGQALIYHSPDVSPSVHTATNFSQFLIDNPTANYQTEAVERIHAVEVLTDFNDSVTNRIQFTNTWDEGQIVLLKNEPEFYLDTTGSAGTGRSRQDSATSIGALANNTPVLVMAGSTINGTLFSQDTVLVVQNGVLGTSAAGATYLIPQDKAATVIDTDITAKVTV